MRTGFKAFLKAQLKRLPFRFTLNQKYDYFTKRIINEQLNPQSNCIDVGCFEGEILDLFLKKSPGGYHFAFEPIPEKFKNLQTKYAQRKNVKIENVALSNVEGLTTFNYVVSNPSYSGLKKRDYDRTTEEDRQITVSTKMLDHCIPANIKIDLIKIDVEGAEYLVMQGAREIIQRWKPLLIFEHGLGASDKYGYGPSDLYSFLSSMGLRIYNMKEYLNGGPSLDLDAFNHQYYQRKNYYFIAQSKLN